jgi:hypothetical protein
VAGTSEELGSLEARRPGALTEHVPVGTAAETLSRLEGRERRELDEIQAARARLAARGTGLFAKYGCQDCHTMGPVGTPIARDLSGIGSRYPESYLLRWLRDPAA